MNADPRLDEMIRLPDAAARLGVHPTTLKRWVREGEIRAFRIGRRGDHRFLQADLDAYLRRAER